MFKWLKIIRFIDEKTGAQSFKGPGQDHMGLGVPMGPGVS